jgi:hypothetical protein
MPAQVHDVLLSHGLIADPHVGKSAGACAWVGEKNWAYVCRFPTPARIGSSAFLRFDATCVDTDTRRLPPASVLKQMETVLGRISKRVSEATLYQKVGNRLDQPTLVVDAQDIADELIDQYCRDGATSFFPRLDLDYDTPTTGLVLGALQTVTLERHGVRNGSFLIRSLTLREEPGELTDTYTWIWTVSAVNTPSLGTWEQFFKRIGVDRQQDDKRDRFSSVDNIVSS